MNADKNDITDPRTPRKGRVSVELATCGLGEIHNVSATGLRVRYRGSRLKLPRLQRPFELPVNTPDGMITVPARIVWVKRCGFRRFDLGVEFSQASPTAQAKLRQLATTAARSRVINDSTGGSRLRAG
jgi:hypothetical protein